MRDRYAETPITDYSLLANAPKLVHQPLYPDLVVTQITYVGDLITGSTVQFRATVTNRGNGLARTSTTGFHFVSGNSIGGLPTPEIPAGSSTALITAPWVATVGAHTIRVTADLTHVVPESDGTNNTRDFTFDVVDPAPVVENPDLVVTDLVVVGNLIEEESLTFRTTVQNQGEGDAVASTLRFNLNGDTFADAATPALLSSASIELTSPAWVAVAGDNTLDVVADVFEVVAEDDETNNTRAIAFSVNELPPPPPPPTGKIAHGVRHLMGSHAYVLPSNHNLTRAEVDGFRLRLSWPDLEPSDGVYTFNDLQTSLDLAMAFSKDVGIGVGAGISCPTWLESKGAIFNSVTIKGVAAREPWPFDPVYMTYWARFIQKLAAQFENHPALKYIVMGGFGQGFGCDVVQVEPDITNFINAGGLPAWAISGHATAAMFAAAFPTTPIILQLNSPIPNNAGKNALSDMVVYVAANFAQHVGFLWEAWNEFSDPTIGSVKIIHDYSPTNITIMQQIHAQAANHNPLEQGDFGSLANAVANIPSLGSFWSSEDYQADLIDANTALWVQSKTLMRSEY